MRSLRHYFLLLVLFLSCFLPFPAYSSGHPFLDNSRPIRWSLLTPDRLEPDIREAMRLTQAAVDRISRLQPEEMTYENTFGALENSNAPLLEGMRKAYVLKSLCDSEELRKAMDATAPRVSAFLSSVTKNQDLWNVLKTAESRLRAANLNSEQKRYMELTMQSFRDNGADLPRTDAPGLKPLTGNLPSLPSVSTICTWMPGKRGHGRCRTPPCWKG